MMEADPVSIRAGCSSSREHTVKKKMGLDIVPTLSPVSPCQSCHSLLSDFLT